MGVTKIEWTDYTWNPWRGCSRVSDGCRFCFADAQSRRSPDVLGIWGPPGVGRRVVAAESYWRLPKQWDRKAEKDGVRRRVFCGSLMDWAEQWDQPVWRDGRQLLVADEEPDRWLPRPKGSERLTPTEEENLRNGVYRQLWLTDVRRRMFEVIDRTPHLDWLQLTKRPENAARMLMPWLRDRVGAGMESPDRAALEHVPPNLWLGTSVENQEWADKRIPQLLRIPAAVRFLSIEPLLGPIDLEPWLHCDGFCPQCPQSDGSYHHDSCPIQPDGSRPKIDWVIVGSESGPHARPMNEDWVRSIRDQCRAAGVPFFYKQRLEGGKKVSLPELDGKVWKESPEVER